MRKSYPESTVRIGYREREEEDVGERRVALVSHYKNVYPSSRLQRLARPKDQTGTPSGGETRVRDDWS